MIGVGQQGMHRPLAHPPLGVRHCRAAPISLQENELLHQSHPNVPMDIYVHRLEHSPLARPLTRRKKGRRGALMTSVRSTKPAVHSTISALILCSMAHKELIQQACSISHGINQKKNNGTEHAVSSVLCHRQDHASACAFQPICLVSELHWVLYSSRCMTHQRGQRNNAPSRLNWGLYCGCQGRLRLPG